MSSVPEDAEKVAARTARQGDPARMLAFTDGIFAIVITILVLEIQVPVDLGSRSLRSAIEAVGPTFTAWVISFFITGMHWVWHRDIFNQVRMVNRDLIWLNIVYMLPVSLVPFASSVLGEYHDEPIALHLYGIVLIAASLCRTFVYEYVMRRPELLWEPFTRQGRRFGLMLSLTGVGVYVVAIVIADWIPTASLVLYLLVPLLYFVLITALRDRSSTSGDAEDYS